MLHIAILINSRPMMAIAQDIRNGLPNEWMADVSQVVLKERIKVRLAQYPNEQWLILSGNTIAERADPPVRFRSI